MNREQLREFGTTGLRRAVIEEIIDTFDNEFMKYTDVLAYLKNVMQYGCQSGMVSSLVYYGDTVEFFEKHKREINEQLGDLVEDIGLPMEDLFKQWDERDPLVLLKINQNLCAWFGFEHTASLLYDEISEKGCNDTMEEVFNH